MSTELVSLVFLPIALGLLGFIEPCSMGANLLFIKSIEAHPPAAKVTAATVFTLTRGLVIGLLGLAAALMGSLFIGVQKAFWMALGSVYLMLGIVYLTGRSGILMRRIGPSLTRLSTTRGTVGLGLLFGLNIPACAAPLLFVLFGAAAGAGTLARGFGTLALFGLALSLPLLIALAVPTVAHRLDRLAGLSRRMPLWTGVVLTALGLWSLWFGLYVRVEEWA